LHGVAAGIERQRVKTVGSLGGFHLSASPVINGATTISIGPGEVVRTDGKRILYYAASVSISNAVPGASKRVYLHDSALALDLDTQHSGARSLLANCDDDESPRGVYEGGFIVAGHVILVAHSSTKQVDEGVLDDNQGRNDRIAQRHAEEKQSGNHAPTKTIANEFGVSATRIRQIVAKQKPAELNRTNRSRKT
jgi:hypothetical protein